MTITTENLDLAMNVFQLQAVDSDGRVVVRKRLRRNKVQLMPPHYAKPYVKRGESEAADAEAICEATTRPSMCLVPVKGTEQQGVLVLHRTRSLLAHQRAMLANALRSHLSEFGILVAKGIEDVAKLTAIVEAEGKDHLPATAVPLSVIVGQLRDLKGRIDALDKVILRWHRRRRRTVA